MTRPIRIEYENAFYHVMNSGRGRQTIFHKEVYYQAFLDILGGACERFDCIVHSYCLKRLNKDIQNSTIVQASKSHHLWVVKRMVMRCKANAIFSITLWLSDDLSGLGGLLNFQMWLGTIGRWWIWWHISLGRIAYLKHVWARLSPCPCLLTFGDVYGA
jgi:hypothetical protein